MKNYLFFIYLIILINLSAQTIHDEMDEYNISDLFDYKDGDLTKFKNDLNWIKMKKIKIFTFKRDHFTKFKKPFQKQLNCLSSSDLCEFSPDLVTCTNFGYDDNDFHVSCRAMLPSNIHFDNFTINCKRKSDTLDDYFDELDEDEIENSYVLEDSCILNFYLKKVDYTLIYFKFAICILSFLIAIGIMICVFKNCRKVENNNESRKVFLTPFYFTRSVSTNSFFH